MIPSPTLFAKCAKRIDWIRAKAPNSPGALVLKTKTTGSIEPSLLSNQLLALFEKACPVLAKPRAKPRGIAEGALPNCRHLTLRRPEAAPRPFSSHFSRTAITDTESQLAQ